MTRLIGVAMLLLAISQLVGCGDVPIKVIYLDKPANLKRVICMDGEAVSAACPVLIKDDGTTPKIVRQEQRDVYGRRQPDRVTIEEFDGCYGPETQTITIPKKDCPTPLFWHEYCHAMGYTDLECLNMFPG